MNHEHMRISQNVQRKTFYGIDLLLQERELAARWNVSVRTLQNRRVQGCSLPFLKLGRSVRYRLSDVVAYEESVRRHSTSEGGEHGAR